MKRLAKETAVYGLSSIVGRFLNWMLVPMYTRVLAGTGDYGIVTNLYGWTALLLVLLTYGMETGFFRFINKKEEQEPMRVYASVLYCLLGSSALFSVAVFALLPSISGLGIWRPSGVYRDDGGYRGGRRFLLHSVRLSSV